MYHYKEPFMEFWDEELGTGYGLRGVLAFDGETDKIQCHFCGKWYGNLSHHISREHNMRVAEYKDRVGLRQSTALVNEHTRQKMIAAGQERFKNLIPGGKKSKKTKKKISETLKKACAERENELGTCHDQLIDRYQKLAEKLGRQPRQDETPFKSTAKFRFGSWENFLNEAGFTVKTNQWDDQIKPRDLITEDMLVEFCTDYFIKYGERPMFPSICKGDKPGSEWVSKFFGVGPAAVWKKMKEFDAENIYMKAVCKTGDMDACKKLRKGFTKRAYTREMLLDFLTSFERMHGRRPSLSDAKRGMLPSVPTYYKYFGNFKKALNEAFGE
jgi:hypothetical protein